MIPRRPFYYYEAVMCFGGIDTWTKPNTLAGIREAFREERAKRLNPCTGLRVERVQYLKPNNRVVVLEIGKVEPPKTKVLT